MAGSSVIGALRVNLGIDSAAFSNGLKAAQSGLARFGSMAKTGLMAAGAAAAGAAYAIGKSVTSTIDAADDMSKAAQKIGIPIEELSRLKYAADLSGVSFEGLQTTVGKLSKGMVEAGNGNKTFAKAFADAGISVKNADGSLRSASDVMMQLADKLKAMPDGAKKTALMMEIMGKSGADMIPLLNGGSEALGNLMKEADTFGQVFTSGMGADAETFNDNISKLTGALGTLAADLTKAILPALVRLSNFAVDIAAGFTSLPQPVQEFIGVSGSLAAALFALAVPLGLVAASFATISWPGVLIASGIALVTAAVIKFWPEIKAAGSAVYEFGRAVIDGLSLLAQQIAEVFAALPGQMVEIGKAIINGLWEGLKSGAGAVKDWVVGFAGDMIEGVKSKLSIHSPSKVMAGIGVNVMEGLGQGMDSMSGSISSIASSIGQTIGDAFGKVIDGSMSVKDALKSVASQVLKMMGNSLIQSVFSGGGAASGFFGSLFKGLLSFDGGGFTGTGGRSGGIDGRGGFPALLHPNESVIDHTRSSAGGGGQAVSINVSINGAAGNEEVARMVRQGIAQAVPGIIGASVESVGKRNALSPGYLRGAA